MTALLFPLTIEQGGTYSNTFILGTTTGTGVVSTTGTTTVTGSNGTLFTKYFTVGNKIRIQGEVQTIATIVSDTQLTTSSAFGVYTKASYGKVYDLTNCSVSSQIRIGDINTELIATFSTTIVTPTSGIFKFSLASSITEALVAGTYQYDLFIHYADGTYAKLLYGPVTVIASTTIIP